jgi:tetratricopeptide (TPR) repeat protein
VTGQHPFAAAGPGDAMLHAHLELQPPRLSHLQPRASAFLEAVVADLLEKDPARRPPSARELARTLAEAESSPFWRARERILPVLASRRRLRAMQRSRHTAFFDRRAEQRVLDQHLEAALAGSGRAVLVSGHGGSGRRRLCDECVDRWLDEHDGLVFVGGIGDDDPTLRLGTPFPQLLLDVLLDGDDENSPHAAERLATRLESEGPFSAGEARALAGICAGDPRQLTLSAAARADLLARGLEHLVRHRHRATVIRIDRIHDLGSVGRLVVARLLERIQTLPALLILVGRPFGEASLGCAELQVDGLPQQAFVAFGEALFRAGAAPEPAVFERAWTTFSGLPRGLQDSLEELAMEGRLAGRPGNFHDLAPTARELRPARPALQQLRDRVSQLPAAQRHVLQGAAVLGDRFDVLDLATLTGRPELEVLESLGAFDHRIVAVERGRGRFRHRDYRLATIAATPPEARRRLHRDAAWVLEDRGAAPLEVGIHLSRALEDAACLEPLLAGLEDLLRQNSRIAAIRVSERLHLHLNRLPRSPAHLLHRLRWLLLAGDAHAAAAQEDKASRAYRKAILIARHLGLPVKRARAMVGLADLAQHKGRLMTAIQLLTQADELFAAADDPAARPTRARALLVHARVMAYQGQSVDALRLTNQALRTLPPGHDALEAHLRIDQARWLGLRLRYGRALQSLARADELAQRAGDPLAELRVHLHRGRILGALGDTAAADAELEAAYALARRLGDERMRGRACLFRAEPDLYVGDLDAARPRLLEAVRAATRAGDRVTGQIAEAWLRLGEPAEAGPREVPFTGIPVVDLAWLLVEGLRRQRAGDRQSAAALLREGLSIERRARVHLPMRLAILRAAGRDALAARLVRALATRVPAGARRRFTAFAERVRL